MEGLQPTKEERPWGNFETFTENKPSTVKILTVNPGEAFSLQTHESRDEYWRVLSGSGVATVGEEKKEAREGAEFFISKGTAHRLEAGETALKVLEISFGQFDEQDIIRLEDRYGRA